MSMQSMQPVYVSPGSRSDERAEERSLQLVRAFSVLMVELREFRKREMSARMRTAGGSASGC